MPYLPVVARRLTYLILTVAGLAVFFLSLEQLAQYAKSVRCRDAEAIAVGGCFVLSIDFVQLRHSGVFDQLVGSKMMEEADYQAFVRDSGFDYKRDLDAVVASFTPMGTFFVVRGRFDWKKLEAYAKQSGGSCYNELCHMPGSDPERRISFVPLSPGLMGLAVGKEDLLRRNCCRMARKGRSACPRSRFGFRFRGRRWSVQQGIYRAECCWHRP